MRRRILIAALLTGAVSTGAAAVPAQAHEGHASCKTFGQTVSENAQTTQPWGQVVSNGGRPASTARSSPRRTRSRASASPGGAEPEWRPTGSRATRSMTTAPTHRADVPSTRLSRRDRGRAGRCAPQLHPRLHTHGCAGGPSAARTRRDERARPTDHRLRVHSLRSRTGRTRTSARTRSPNALRQQLRA
jgi:hypothetical protein